MISARTSSPALARAWRCEQCGVSVRSLDGEPIPLPDAWTDTDDGCFCLACRRDRVAEAALREAPADTTRDARARMRRTALVEFEMRRNPEHTNGEIAKACRASIKAVAEVRRRLELPDPPSAERRAG